MYLPSVYLNELAEVYNKLKSPKGFAIVYFFRLLLVHTLYWLDK